MRPSAVPGPSPYGPLAAQPDENGFLLPAGFRSRVVAVAGDEVAATGFVFPVWPDGAGTVSTADGGWILVVNSEVFPVDAPDAGSVSALRFDASGDVVDARSILVGSRSNCGGSMTPWGTWLSCEEKTPDADGKVWECDPTGRSAAVDRPALGRFHHESAVVDPATGIVYLTEDSSTGLFRRFRPETPGDLSAGRLEAMVVTGDRFDWVAVDDPAATRFPGSEGLAVRDGILWFDTKSDDRVHRLDLEAGSYSVLWDSDAEIVGVNAALLSGVDTIAIDTRTGDLFVAEDGGNMELVLISAEGSVAPFLRLADPSHASSEISGQCFTPDGTRMYVASMRGPGRRTVGELVPDVREPLRDSTAVGIVYEITGPFRGLEPAAPSTTVTDVGTTMAGTTTSAATTPLPPSTKPTETSDTGSSTDTLPFVVGAGVVAIGGIVAWRRRRMRAIADRMNKHNR